MNYNLSGPAKMIIDLRNGSFKAYSNESKERTNEAIRAIFKEIMPQPNAVGRVKMRALKEAIPKAFAIIEEVLDVTVNEAWNTIPFYNEFVDSRNLALGERNDFVIEDDSWITINKFSGNTWDTDREKLGPRRKISIDTEWFYARVYDDYERFLIGSADISFMVDRMTQSFIRHVDTLIAATFNDAANNLPIEFMYTGAIDMNTMKEYIAKVRTYSRKNVRILGTEMAIAQLNSIAEVKYSENMMNELYSTGRLGKWMGNTIVEIPQAFTPGTYDWAIDNDKLLIVPENEKFIKLVDEGETRINDLDWHDTHDQTLDVQMQRKLGAAAVFGTMLAKIEIA